MPSSSVSPPTTVDQLRNSINNAQNATNESSEEESNISGDHLRGRLDRIFTGSLIQAELAAQHQQDIKKLLHANQRKNWKKTRRSLQTGGVLSIKDANHRIEAKNLERMKKDVRRAQQDQKILEKEKERLANRPPLNEAENEALEGFMVGPDGEPLIFKNITSLDG
ncbi:hypothetical protein MPDQ_005515 [Monascus purpureus]|uniref:Uncharacterized protein n=1 Tax=Monascus purpureus TaxID=5098 RepID=A0A507R2R2_MONPU|nr:hypothetical protein MPDQ_005515 [Monascus purpureus]